MKHTNWTNSRPFQDDPAFPGRQFAEHIRQTGRLPVILSLATALWKGLSTSTVSHKNSLRKATFDSMEP